jgi:hypothetical protein
MKMDFGSAFTACFVSLVIGVTTANVHSKNPSVAVAVESPVIHGEVKSIACYNPDGVGPMVRCPAHIECYNKENSNSNASRVPCPFFSKDSDPIPYRP